MLGSGGTATVIGAIPESLTIEIDAVTLLRGERRLQASFMGSKRFRVDMPRYLDWYRQGRRKPVEPVCQRPRLKQIDHAFEDTVRIQATAPL